MHLHCAGRLKQALAEASAKEEEKLAAVAEYAELVKTLEKRQREDAKEVKQDT